MTSLIWFGLGIALIFLEFLVGDLSMLMLAGGALAAAGVSLADTPLWLDIVVFTVVSVGLMGLARPALRRRMAAGGDSEKVESNPKQLTGRAARVEEAIDSDSGLIRVAGELWSARALVPGTEFAPGDRVTVVAIDGNTAVVDKEV